MKKLMMAVAAVVGLGLGFVHAKELVDFDRGSFESADFMEAIKTHDTCQNDKIHCEKAAPMPTRVFSEEVVNNTNSSKMYELDKAGRQMLRQAMLRTSDKLFDKNTLLLINNEKAGILYNNEKVLFIDTIDDNRLAILLESDDSRLIHLLLALNNQAMPQTKQLLSPVTICNLVEVIGGAYIMKKVGEIWTQVWVETKKLVKQCHTEYVEVPDTGGSGSTYHNGQGGNSNYDVNKSLK